MKTVLLLTLVSISALAQDMSAADNQCRTEAKEIALKSYQSCIATARTARLEEIRKEYQSKLAELKKQYEGQLQELKKQNKSVQKSQKPETTADKLNEPTIVLKKAKGANTKSAANKPAKTIKSKSSNTPTIITEAELEKSALPAAEPTSAEATLETTAPVAAEPTVIYETNEATGETENLQVIDPTLPVQAQ